VIAVQHTDTFIQTVDRNKTASTNAERLLRYVLAGVQEQVGVDGLKGCDVMLVYRVR
jgi:hypothetical protein